MRLSLWRRIRTALTPRPDPDPNVPKRGLGWGWLVFVSILAIVLYALGSARSALREWHIVVLISIPVSVVIYFVFRKLIIDKGHFGDQAWIGSFWAGAISFVPCVFIVAVVTALFGLVAPKDPAGGSTAFGLPEVILMLVPFAVIMAITVAIVHLIDRRFRKSKKHELTERRLAAPFASPEAAGSWTRALLAATIVLDAVAVYSWILWIELLSRFNRGVDYTIEEASRSVSRGNVVDALQILLDIGTAVAFLIWLHRAYKNLPSLGQRHFRFTPGWAVGFFFIPFLNFFRPFQAMRELWHGSDPRHWEPDDPPDGAKIQDRTGTPPLVGWWWALFCVSNVIANIAVRLSLAESVASAQTSGVLMVVSNILSIPSALVTIRLVGRLTRRQTEKARLIGQRGEEAASNEDPFAGAEVKTKGRENILITVAGFLAISILAASFFAFRGSWDGNEGSQKTSGEGRYITLGSTQEEVLRIQGTPTFKLERVWFYGDSQVQFDSDGRVAYIWNYSKNLNIEPEKRP
jgi:hypothetical protein